jgi:membrane peptidoglycan carboxypeptidase
MSTTIREARGVSTITQQTAKNLFLWLTDGILVPDDGSEADEAAPTIQ